MNKGLKTFKLFSQGDYCCELTKDELLSHCFRVDEEWLKENWKMSCGYFSKFSDGQGVCIIGLDDFIDGNVLDHQKRVAATMTITALIDIPSKFEVLPRHIIINSFTYLHAMIFELDYALYKEKTEAMLTEFECKALVEMKAAWLGERSFDDVLDSILDYMPSIKCISGLKEEGKHEHIEFFENLLDFTKYSSTSYYENIIEEYLDAIKGR